MTMWLLFESEHRSKLLGWHGARLPDLPIVLTAGDVR